MKKLFGFLKRLFRRPFEMSKDMKLACVECGNGFRFEWGEQQFFKSCGLTPPKRCATCRAESRGGDRRRQGRRRR